MSLLKEAKERLSIPFLWRHFNFPGTVKDTCCVKSPFRDDENPSFSIYERGTMFKDHGCDDHGDSYTFFQYATKADSKTAYRPFIELAGLADRLEPRGKRSEGLKRETPKPEEPEPKAESKQPPDPPEYPCWQECVDAARIRIGELQRWRGFSSHYARGLVDLGRIAYHDGCWAFPVRYSGKVVGLHCRIKPKSLNAKPDWFYEPPLKALGIPIQPYAFSSEGRLVRSIHCTESPWDGLSLDDKLKITESGEAVFSTRGAPNAKLLSKIPRSVQEIYLWPQNDDAGKKWLVSALAALAGHPSTVKVARVPEQWKDLNEWILAGATADDLLETMKNAEVRPKTEEAHQEETQNGNGSRKRLLLPNHSLAHYARRQINHDNTLLGNRWLCRTNGAIIVAPSGMGKSSCSLQTAILWSCGKIAFGIKPSKTLRILILQAEDDEDDTTEMCAMLDNPKLGLTEAEKQLVEKNTHLERVNDCTGQQFLDVLEGYLEQDQFDLVILNPLSAYVSDPGDTKEMSTFLRVGLNRLLVKFNIGVVLIHHTPKTNFQKEKNLDWYDWMYIGAGVAGLTNWARAILVIWPTDIEGTFRFIAAKRIRRIGWLEREYLFSHSKGDVIIWEVANEEEIQAVKSAKEEKHPSTASKRKVAEMLLPYMSEIDWRSEETISALANEEGQPGISDRRVPVMLKALVELKKAEMKTEPRPRTQPLKLYRKITTSDSRKKAANDEE